MKTMIGFEAEYLLKQGDSFVFPCGDADAYPLLGECRGLPSEDPVMAAASVLSLLEERRANSGGRVVTLGEHQVDLATHREALRRVSSRHNKQIELDKCKNISGSRVDDVDVVRTNDAGERCAFISTGLHVHFSCEDKQERAVEHAVYEPVVIPISIQGAEITMYLHRASGFSRQETITARASIITLPVVEHIVRTLDAIGEEKGMFRSTSRYRRAGFWEPKPWGFEYRSFPADDSTMNLEFLTSIAKLGIGLLNGMRIAE